MNGFNVKVHWIKKKEAQYKSNPSLLQFLFYCKCTRKFVFFLAQIVCSVICLHIGSFCNSEQKLLHLLQLHPFFVSATFFWNLELKWWWLFVHLRQITRHQGRLKFPLLHPWGQPIPNHLFLLDCQGPVTADCIHEEGYGGLWSSLLKHATLSCRWQPNYGSAMLSGI